MATIWLFGPICLGGLAFAWVQRVRIARWRIGAFYGVAAALLLSAMAWVRLNPEPINV